MPLYRQLANVLRAMASEDEALAFTEEQLCQRFQVSRTTVRQALQRLEGEGVLTRLQGKGTTVIPWKDREARPLRVFGSIEDMISYGRETTYTLIEHGVTLPPSEVAESLEAPPEAQNFRFLGIRASEGVPFALIETWQPYQIGVQILPLIKDGVSPIVALNDAQIGIQADTMEQVVSVGLAPEALASHIGLQPGEPILVIRRLYSDVNGNRIGFSINYCNTERFQYRMRLQRRSKP